MFLVLSTSLHPDSRSRILARAATKCFTAMGRDSELFDLAQTSLPACDGATAYGDANVVALDKKIRAARAVLIASPVYNYDVNAAAKNAVELTGKAWTEKVVGMMLAAGGHGSYMSAMGLAGSLMLDFRCLIVPRFIYAVGTAFSGDELIDNRVQERVTQLVQETVRLADAVDTWSP